MDEAVKECAGCDDDGAGGVKEAQFVHHPRGAPVFDDEAFDEGLPEGEARLGVFDIQGRLVRQLTRQM